MYIDVFPLQVVISTRCTLEDGYGMLALWSLYSMLTLRNSSPLLLPKTVNCKHETCDYSSQSGGMFKFKGGLSLKTKI